MADHAEQELQLWALVLLTCCITISVLGLRAGAIVRWDVSLFEATVTAAGIWPVVRIVLAIVPGLLLAVALAGSYRSALLRGGRWRSVWVVAFASSTLLLSITSIGAVLAVGVFIEVRQRRDGNLHPISVAICIVAVGVATALPGISRIGPTESVYFATDGFEAGQVIDVNRERIVVLVSYQRGLLEQAHPTVEVSPTSSLVGRDECSSGYDWWSKPAIKLFDRSHTDAPCTDFS